MTLAVMERAIGAESGEIGPKRNNLASLWSGRCHPFAVRNIAHENRMLAKEHQVEIVIVIEVKPDGIAVFPFGQSEIRRSERTAVVAVNGCLRIRDDTKLQMSVVVVIARLDREHAFKLL